MHNKSKSHHRCLHSEPRFSMRRNSRMGSYLKHKYALAECLLASPPSPPWAVRLPTWPKMPKAPTLALEQTISRVITTKICITKTNKTTTERIQASSARPIGTTYRSTRQVLSATRVCFSEEQRRLQEPLLTQVASMVWAKRCTTSACTATSSITRTQKSSLNSWSLIKTKLSWINTDTMRTSSYASTL